MAHRSNRPASPRLSRRTFSVASGWMGASLAGSLTTLMVWVIIT